MSLNDLSTVPVVFKWSFSDLSVTCMESHIVFSTFGPGSKQIIPDISGNNFSATAQQSSNGLQHSPWSFKGMAATSQRTQHILANFPRLFQSPWSSSTDLPVAYPWTPVFGCLAVSVGRRYSQRSIASFDFSESSISCGTNFLGSLKGYSVITKVRKSPSKSRKIEVQDAVLLST